MSSSGDSGTSFAPTANDDISPPAFYSLTWIFFALCNIAFAVRAYIRYACFRRFLLEDYIMMFALLLHNVEAVLIQLFVGYAYDLEAVEKGDYSKIGPNFFDNSHKAFIGIGTSVNLTIVGVLLVKINFMIFFRRLGEHIQKFNILWWGVLLFTIAGAAAQIGMQEFNCFFGKIEDIFSGMCTSDAALHRIFFNAIFSATVDAVSDFLILGFPVVLLWKSRISTKKKLALTLIFGLVFLTIAITIVRGSIFHQVYDGTGVKGSMQSATFTWFWFYCEFSVAFIIACVVSFRTLFVQQRNQSSIRYNEEQRREAEYRDAMQRGWRVRLRHFHDSVIYTCKSLEGYSSSDASSMAMRGIPQTGMGLMTVDFNDDTNWRRDLVKTDPQHSFSVDRSVSRNASVASVSEESERSASAQSQNLPQPPSPIYAHGAAHS
ncbi:hypothetical protein GQ53DRAFT_752963 [Thozetella sp. PMI_491]|nr:hypothetical protein GQ53DRAFT_752963 [Thozetella sp. PMI_491]